METRKLISFGSSSYVISLPKNWVSQNRLEKGDALYIEEKSNELIITSGDSEKQKEVKEKQIDCSNKPLENIKCELFAAYLNNYNIIELRQLDEERIPKVKEMLQGLAGLEILEQTADKIIAKDLINIKEVSIKALMRRIDIIIRSMMDDALTSDQKNNVKSLYDRDEDINRLHYLVRRMITAALEDQKISRMFETEPKDVLLDWEVALRLEKIGDNVKRINKCVSKTKIEDKKFPVILDIFNKLKSKYLSVMKAYYGKDINIACEVETGKREIYDKCDDILANGCSTSKQCVVLVENLKTMNARIADIAKAVVMNGV